MSALTIACERLAHAKASLEKAAEDLDKAKSAYAVADTEWNDAMAEIRGAAKPNLPPVSFLQQGPVVNTTPTTTFSPYVKWQKMGSGYTRGEVFDCTVSIWRKRIHSYPGACTPASTYYEWRVSRKSEAILDCGDSTSLEAAQEAAATSIFTRPIFKVPL